jgi:hypothetical protein
VVGRLDAVQEALGGRLEAQFVQGRRAEVKQQRPHVVDRLRHEVPGFAQDERQACRGFPRGQALLEFHLGQREGLDHVVVQAGGDAAALLFLGHGQFRPERPEALLVRRQPVLGPLALGDFQP